MFYCKNMTELGLYRISAPALALVENRPFFTNLAHIRLRPKCSRICKMAHINTAMFHISTSVEKSAVDVAIFPIRLFTLLRCCYHLVTEEILHYEYPSSVSSFMDKPQIWNRPQMDLCCQIRLQLDLQNLNPVQP